MKLKKRILIAPLNWGIGHATRCIPLINALISHNYEVVIAADERPLHLLITEFPDLEIVRFSGYCGLQIPLLETIVLLET